MAKIGRFVILAMVFFAMSLAQAQNDGEVKVEAVVDRNEVGVGESFTLTIRVTGSGSLGDTEPRLPGLSDFDLLRTWEGRSTRSTFVQGKFSTVQTQEYNFQLSPKEKGIAKIGEVELNVGGKIFKTRPIEVSVGESSGNSGNVAQGNPFADDEDEDIFNLLLRQRGIPTPGLPGRVQPQGRNVNPSEAFFIDVEVSKEKVYKGEGITVSYYLYTRGNISEIDTLKHPSLQGFLREDIEVSQRLSFTGAVVNGIQYSKALLASYAVFPMKEGILTIDEYKAKCTVIMSAGFGFGRPYRYTKSSKPVKIEVLPLPIEGMPDGFNGAIGDFKVKANLEKSSVPVNQPVSLKVRFEGSRGNAKVIELPHMDLPPSLELYDTKTDAKFFRNGNSYKEFEVLLIPREVGDVTIPELRFPIFNPVNERYEVKTVASLQLQVTPDGTSQTISSSPLPSANQPNADSPVAISDRLPGLAMGWQEKGRWSTAEVSGLWAAVYLFITLLLLWRARLVLGWGAKKLTLQKKVSQRFAKIHKLAAQGDWRKVGVELSNAIYFSLGAISDEKSGSQEMEKILESAPPSVRRQLGSELRGVMTLAQTLGFAPEAVIGDLKDKKTLQKNVKLTESLLLKAVAIGTSSGTEKQ